MRGYTASPLYPDILTHIWQLVSATYVQINIDTTSQPTLPVTILPTPVAGSLTQKWNLLSLGEPRVFLNTVIGHLLTCHTHLTNKAIYIAVKMLSHTMGEVKTKWPLKILAVLALIMGVLSILHSKKLTWDEAGKLVIQKLVLSKILS